MILTTNIRSVEETSVYVHQMPFTHAPELFTGVLFGCLAAQPRKLGRWSRAFTWTLAAIAALASVFGVYSWSRGRAPEALESAFFAGLHRFAWAFAVSWTMYACASGCGGLIHKLLACPLWYPLGRLSFGVYLLNPMVIVVNIVLSRERKTYQPFLGIECPVEGLDAVLFQWMKAEPAARSEVPKQNERLELKLKT
ncbi:nose resistant to fluoxetine protein 6-like [Ixodes scapularis]|uniref:nose resistant to fluoxetine protein 6-like n=1 Tax=Ixodes scapularis TaxID=6945 RepID=UPI001C38E020|nr:nose resistant to fluoxetine protein 6-like [Ixodes scapularis]